MVGVLVLEVRAAGPELVLGLGDGRLLQCNDLELGYQPVQVVVVPVGVVLDGPT